ncbi:hypothetical protein [Salinibacterium sp. ZJ450]|uniref:hypothetical protein n=1 Tax=Salinibacterium sp. ZJ450 TaxID=2708338 RepID=UPI0014235A1A|nr:hypothetical protein [Salinibacterium sp. ZJ450]
MQQTHEAVALWTDAGVPVRLVWEGRRFRVTDSPTSLGDSVETWWHPALTHPLDPGIGWRFQASDDSGETHMFEVRYDERRGGWALLRVYD